MFYDVSMLLCFFNSFIKVEELAEIVTLIKDQALSDESVDTVSTLGYFGYSSYH